MLKRNRGGDASALRQDYGALDITLILSASRDLIVLLMARWQEGRYMRWSVHLRVEKDP